MAQKHQGECVQKHQEYRKIVLLIDLHTFVFHRIASLSFGLLTIMFAALVPIFAGGQQPKLSLAFLLDLGNKQRGNHRHANDKSA